MLNIFKRRFELLAPISGRVLDLSKTPDPVFADKLAGDGVVIDTTGDIVVSPADGVLTLIFRTNHAIGITLSNGIELLVHIGIDTVELSGEGFERIAVEGETVKAGEPIIRINRKLIEGKGYSLYTPVLITNPDLVKDIKYNIDTVVTMGKNSILSYKMK